MVEVQMIRAALERSSTQDAIDAALGDKAPAFWGEVAQAMQDIEQASDPTARDAAIGQLEALCRRYPAVWNLVTPGEPQPTSSDSTEEEKLPMTTTPPPKPAQPEKPSSDVTLESALAALREGVTGCLGVLIVLTTLSVVFCTFFLLLLRPGGDFAPFRDLLLILNGMTGAVLGYYFGRMPAEARARQAEAGRVSAEQDASKATTRAAVLRSVLQDVKASLDRQALAVGVPKGAPPTPALPSDLRDRIERTLEETA